MDAKRCNMIKQCEQCARISDVVIPRLSSRKRTFSAVIPAKKNDNRLLDARPRPLKPSVLEIWRQEWPSLR